MDQRSVLPAGTLLPFPGMTCRIDECVGWGSNAIVYRAGYQDATSTDQRHHILIKELFPLDSHGRIRRGEDGTVQRSADADALWQTHLTSFERGNTAHLQLLALRPDQLGGNLNTFALNGTLYTILDDRGSRSLEKALAGKPAGDLRTAAVRCLRLLDCLEIFHRQGFLHLDISPDNALLIGDKDAERVMLIDYNSVHSIGEIQSGAALYFSTKEGFTAPEAQTGMVRDISYCTDLFSVTAVFYTMLSGKAPTLPQLNRKKLPDAQDSPLLRDAPSTVREQVKKIMRRGLCTLPDRRYPSCAAMKKDLNELLGRLDGLGVSHAALWEAGRRGVLRLVRQNPSLAYLEQEAGLYPLRLTWEETGRSVFLKDFMAEASASSGLPVLLEGAGGSGKSTALLRTVLSAPPVYSAKDPAVICISLSDWKESGRYGLLDRILSELRFDANTRTLEEARRVLTERLSKPILFKGESRPALLLLLDGLNEVPGDTAPLLREITALSKLPGLSVVIAGRICPDGFAAKKARLDLLVPEDVDLALSRRGLLMPEKKEMRELLRTPLMLSLFIQTAAAQHVQMRCETEAELVDAYLDALCEKAGQEGDAARYLAQAAVYLVLPAIAREEQKQTAAPDDRLLLAPVVRCRGLIDTRTVSRAFPQWIGHGADITGGGISDEAWYGRVVHDTLWKRLGLLIRDEKGAWHIRHEVLKDHLLRMDAMNRSSVRKARVRLGAVFTGLIACAALILFLTRTSWYGPAYLKEVVPPPDMDILAAAASREYDPADPDHDDLTETLRLAQEGDVWQQYGMGILYEDGTGVEKDYRIARQYYLLAASQGLPEAYLRLGIFYQYGFGVEVSMKAAAACYEKAAQMGSADALASLGVMYLNGEYYSRSDEKAFEYFRSARDRNSPEGSYWLGQMYLQGRGAEKSLEQAVKLFQSALSAAYAPAAEALGDLYCDEESGLKDLSEARYYYQTASDMGLVTAAEKLAALPGE